jgi:hypothetical protein
MSDANPPDDEALNVLSVRLSRLSAPPTIAAPTVDELGLTELEDECEHWELQRGSSDMWELNTRHDQPADTWRVLPRLMGSITESALLACTAQVEIECFRRGIADGSLPPAAGLAQRFFAEGQAQLILGVGHRLANITLRMMMLAPGYPWGEQVARREHLADPAPPLSEDRKHWIGMAELARFRKVAEASPYRTLERIVDEVVAISGSPTWVALDEQRGKDFHRVRHESPFVIGSSRASSWTSDGTTRTFSGGVVMPTADEVARWQADLGQESHDALLALAGWLREFRGALSAAVTDITGGGFRLG